MDEMTHGAAKDQGCMNVGFAEGGALSLRVSSSNPRLKARRAYGYAQLASWSRAHVHDAVFVC